MKRSSMPLARIVGELERGRLVREQGSPPVHADEACAFRAAAGMPPGRVRSLCRGAGGRRGDAA